jgi:Flp pilus assembly protein TadB
MASKMEAPKQQLDEGGGEAVLWTIFVILLIGWLVGVVNSYMIGGYIHILLLLAVVALLVQFITGRHTAL